MNRRFRRELSMQSTVFIVRRIETENGAYIMTLSEPIELHLGNGSFFMIEWHWNMT